MRVLQMLWSPVTARRRPWALVPWSATNFPSPRPRTACSSAHCTTSRTSRAPAHYTFVPGDQPVLARRTCTLPNISNTTRRSEPSTIVYFTVGSHATNPKVRQRCLGAAPTLPVCVAKPLIRSQRAVWTADHFLSHTVTLKMRVDRLTSQRLTIPLSGIPRESTKQQFAQIASGATATLT